MSAEPALVDDAAAAPEEVAEAPEAPADVAVVGDPVLTAPEAPEEVPAESDPVAVAADPEPVAVPLAAVDVTRRPEEILQLVWQLVYARLSAAVPFP